MLTAQLVFVTLVVVISLYSYFTFKQRVEKKKKYHGQIKNALHPRRQLSQQETETLREYYAIDIRPGSPVFSIEGACSMDALKEGSQVVQTHHWLGDIRVTFFEEWEPYLRPHNHAEIVFAVKNGEDIGLILNLNDVVDIRHLVERKKKIQKGLAGEIKEAGIRITGSRPLTPAESRFFSMDGRFSAWLLITLGIWCLFFSGKHPVGPVAAGVLAGLGLLLFSFKRTQYQEKVMCFSGRFSRTRTAVSGDGEASSTTQYYIGEVAVEPPEHWKPFLPIDRDCRAEGLLTIYGKSTPRARLVSVDDILSLKTEGERFGHESVARHLMGGVLLALSLFLFWMIAQTPATHMKMAWNALIRSPITAEYTEVKDLIENPPYVGQKVQLTHLQVTPVFSSQPATATWSDGTALMNHPAITGIIAVDSIPDWNFPDLSPERKIADGVLILCLQVSSHIRHFGDDYFLLVGQESLISGLQRTCAELPEQFQCQSIIQWVMGNNDDDGRTENQNGENAFSPRLFLDRDAALSLNSEIMSLFQQTENLANDRIHEALVRRNSLLAAQPSVLISATGLWSQFEAPMIQFGELEDMDVDFVQAAFSPVMQGNPETKLIRAIDWQAVVLGVGRRGNASYELVLDRDLTPVRHRAFILQGMALTGCAALLPLLLIRILMIAEGNKKRALLIRRYYEEKLMG